MTQQAEELIGAQVTGADGKVIGSVEQVFWDEADGTPAWARIRSGRASRFVPLGSSQVTRDGLSVPYDAQQIMDGPKIEAGERMSAEQVEDLGRYFLTLPAPSEQQRGRGDDGGQHGRADEGQQRGRAEEGQQRGRAEEGQQRGRAEEGQQRGKKGDEDWLLRREERLQLDKETVESGKVKLHRYVDEEKAEETVHLVHEEYDVERAPVAQGERAEGDLGEDEQEVVLHSERVIVNKETVPVERMRLKTRQVEEDKKVGDAIRRERIEVEPQEAAEFEQVEVASAGGGRGRSRSRS